MLLCSALDRQKCAESLMFDRNNPLLTLTDIFRREAASVRKPVVVERNDNTAIAGCNAGWKSAPPATVLDVDLLSIYIRTQPVTRVQMYTADWTFTFIHW